MQKKNNSKAAVKQPATAAASPAPKKTKSKKAAKSTEKEVLVNLTSVNSVNDVIAEFALGKLNADEKVSREEVAALFIQKSPVITVVRVEENTANMPKKNIFKRFWNWLIGKK